MVVFHALLIISKACGADQFLGSCNVFFHLQAHDLFTLPRLDKSLHVNFPLCPVLPSLFLTASQFKLEVRNNSIYKPLAAVCHHDAVPCWCCTPMRPLAAPRAWAEPWTLAAAGNGDQSRPLGVIIPITIGMSLVTCTSVGSLKLQSSVVRCTWLIHIALALALSSLST